MELNQLIPLLRTLLASELGTITTLNNQQIKAITVEPGPPSGASVNGLLCVVQRVPEGVATEVTSGKFLDYQWVIRLTQFDKTQSIDKALKLIQESPLFRVKQVVYLGPTSQNYEQCRIVIWNPSLIRYS